MEQSLLEVLVCIQCHGQLEAVERGRALSCAACEVRYPVRDGIPQMRLEEALSSSIRQSNAQTPASGRIASFRIAAGTRQGQRFELPFGACKAIGRASAEMRHTGAQLGDVSLSLDDHTRKLIHQYVRKQYAKDVSTAPSELGFRRTGDIILDDAAVSRLHAMIFFDTAGVGVLDLVSKNGTFVNGAEVESCMLTAGDQVSIGSAQFELVSVSAAHEEKI